MAKIKLWNIWKKQSGFVLQERDCRTQTKRGMVATKTQMGRGMVATRTGRGRVATKTQTKRGRAATKTGMVGRPRQARGLCVRVLNGKAHTYCYVRSQKQPTKGMIQGQNLMQEATRRAKEVWADPIQKHLWEERFEEYKRLREERGGMSSDAILMEMGVVRWRVATKVYEQIVVVGTNVEKKQYASRRRKKNPYYRTAWMMLVGVMMQEVEKETCAAAEASTHAIQRLYIGYTQAIHTVKIRNERHDVPIKLLLQTLPYPPLEGGGKNTIWKTLPGSENASLKGGRAHIYSRRGGCLLKHLKLRI